MNTKTNLISIDSQDSFFFVAISNDFQSHFVGFGKFFEIVELQKICTCIIFGRSRDAYTFSSRVSRSRLTKNAHEYQILEQRLIAICNY